MSILDLFYFNYIIANKKQRLQQLTKHTGDMEKSKVIYRMLQMMNPEGSNFLDILIKFYINGDPEFEDGEIDYVTIEYVKDILTRFNEYKNYMSQVGQPVDIYQFNSVDQIVDALVEYEENLKNKSNNTDLNVVDEFEDSEGNVYKLHKTSSSADVVEIAGEEIGWCIKQGDMYDEYVQNGTIYIATKNGRPDAAFVNESYDEGIIPDADELANGRHIEFVNRFNEPISSEQYTVYSNWINKIFQDWMENGNKAQTFINKAKFYTFDGTNFDTESFKEYLIENEEMFATDPEMAWKYVSTVTHEPFPSGEAAIATNGQRSYSYASRILGQRFPAGETAISKHSSLSLDYAINIIGGRFPEGEPAIATRPRSSYLYAAIALEGRFPEGEDTISTSSFYSFEYATLVLGERFLPGEFNIMNSEYRDNYIERFPEALREEQELLGNTQQEDDIPNMIQDTDQQDLYFQ